MAEPLPSASNHAVGEVAADNEDTPVSRLPRNAEDRKAAAALDSLNTNEMTQDEAGGGGGATQQPSKADQEALGKAMSRLEIASGSAAAPAGKDGSKKTTDKKQGEEGEIVEAKKKVKVSADDVQFLVEELELPKSKATELLKAHDGNLFQAAEAFITPPIKV